MKDTRPNPDRPPAEDDDLEPFSPAKITVAAGQSAKELGLFAGAEDTEPLKKSTYTEAVEPLRHRLFAAQQRRREADRPVILLLAGVDGAGKGDVLNRLSKWLDPRWFRVVPFDAPAAESQGRPEFWRVFESLPPGGQLGLFVGGWHSDSLVRRAYGEISKAEFEHDLERIAELERMLSDDGYLMVKIWLHLDKAGQKRRFKKLEKDPLTSWRVTEKDWRHWKLYSEFVRASRRLIERTGTEAAPWYVVEGNDARARDLAIGRILAHRIESDANGSGNSEATPAEAEGPPAATGSGETNKKKSILADLDMSASLDPDTYSTRYKELRARLATLQRRAREVGIAGVHVFEGWDAAGKGGAIRRVTQAWDARDYSVVRIAAPTDEELTYHYLWRFWRHIPPAGRHSIFDRSWYGRVLVERVEGFASPEQWRRAFEEIRIFERELVDHGVLLLKFWLHITPEEQAARFEERQRTPHKRWKLTEEDWRNRERWADYEQAVAEMIAETSTDYAPWTVFAANDKLLTRIQVLETVCKALEERLAGRSSADC